MSELDDLRAEVAAYATEHCPPSLIGRGGFEIFSGGAKENVTDDTRRWFDAMYERGWSVPHWPKEFGGAGLSGPQHLAFREGLSGVGAPGALGGMGVTMIGPTLLEHGTDEQKARHLSKITSGEFRWCQGYSEPGAGSDLASLKTRAEDRGDHYLVNGSKIWTSGANFADWIFCLVRTDSDAPKHEGISFLLFSMDGPGVTVKPIKLISGNSPFCECFFDDVQVPKDDLIGKENRGWTIAKRLLQHERAGISGLGGSRAAQGGPGLQDIARDYCGDAGGRIDDAAVRSSVTEINMNARAFGLTQRRSHEENTSGGTVTFATSMFKYYSSELNKARQELTVSMLGTRGVGWSGESFSGQEKAATRMWLRGKAGTIAGGSSEVQLNIVAKRVLGLPD